MSPLSCSSSFCSIHRVQLINQKFSKQQILFIYTKLKFIWRKALASAIRFWNVMKFDLFLKRLITSEEKWIAYNKGSWAMNHSGSTPKIEFRRIRKEFCTLNFSQVIESALSTTCQTEWCSYKKVAKIGKS